VRTNGPVITILTGLCLLLTTAGNLHGQNREELEKKRKQLLEEIDQTDAQLKATKRNKAATLERYFALQNQIEKRQQLINTLRAEVRHTEDSISRTEEVLQALNDDTDRLKAEYARMIRTAFRHRLNNSYLLFLFSARSLNDAFRRWQYIRQYDRYRERQARLIQETQKTLKLKAEQLKNRKAEKEQLLTSQRRQKKLIGQELQDKNQLLESLKADESRLVAELEAQQKAAQKLNNAIESIIREEMARKREEARSREDRVNVSPEEVNATDLETDNFFGRRGRLPWPVQGGQIVKSFGTQPHPTIKTIQITNNGIDIRTGEQAEVFAVSSGKVAGTQYIPSYQHMVILQHGEYYTVYSNMEEIFVRRGEEVSAREAIGRLGASKPVVHFEVWREKERLNPTQWVARQ